MTVKARAEAVLGKDLQPGDLFSTAGSRYWDNAMDKESIGEKVYIRTNAPCPENQENVSIYRVVVLGGQDQLKLFVWEDVLYNWTSGVVFALACDVEEARRAVFQAYEQSIGEHVKNPILLASLREQVEKDIQKEPLVVAEQGGFLLWGGG